MTFTERMSEQYDNRPPVFCAPDTKHQPAESLHRPDWTTEEKRKVRREYPTRNTLEIAADMNRTVFAVRTMALQLGAKKLYLRDNVEFLDSVLAEYASATADEIAARRGVKVVTVRKWIALARGNM